MNTYSSATIREVTVALAGQKQAGIATLAAKIIDSEEIFNPNAVKVVLNKAGYALYFSRAPIPWERDTFAQSGRKPSGKIPIFAYRTICLYGRFFKPLLFLGSVTT